MNYSRLRARIIGILFILPLLFYGIGSTLVTQIMDAPKGMYSIAEAHTHITTGAILIVMNSLTVAALGVLVFLLIRTYSIQSARIYLVARSVEALLLALGLIILVTACVKNLSQSPFPGSVSEIKHALEIQFLLYQWAMIALGAGSILFCNVLRKQQLIPFFIAVWGMIGYALLTLGSIVELVQLFPREAAAGILLSIPGGLFKLTLGFYLLIYGFKNQAKS